MTDSQRTLQEIYDTFKCCPDAQSFDKQAATYNSDNSRIGYTGPKITADAVKKHLPLSPDQVRVLDVACGTGLVAEELSALGFRQFVGVDGSQGMLDQARLTGLYQELHLTMLGTQPLPAAPGQFDVVAMVGALYRKFVPLDIVRELWKATKPGGLVAIARVNYQTPGEVSFTEELYRELGLMEAEGLWTRLVERQVERYVSDFFQTGSFLTGSLHVFQKTL